jgi:hypothetical protein
MRPRRRGQALRQKMAQLAILKSQRKKLYVVSDLYLKFWSDQRWLIAL